MHTLTARMMKDAIAKQWRYKVSYGCDPEVFAVDSDGIPRSLVGKLGGSKEEPLPVPQGAIQEDNVTGEFNTIPAFTKTEFLKNMATVRKELYRRINKAGLRPYPVPHAVFPDEELQTPQAARFGCEPDMNVWTGQENPAPTCDNPNLRTAAGHIHIGFSAGRILSSPYIPSSENDNLLIDRLVVLADLYIGVPSVLLDPDVTRRKLYGKAGAYRAKNIGNLEQPLIVEYRTPSNFWIKNRVLAGWMYDQMKLISHCQIGMRALGDFYPDPEYVQDCINTGDQRAAKNLVQAYDIQLPARG